MDEGQARLTLADPAGAQVAPVARWAVRAVPAPASGLAMAGLTAGPLAVTDDGAGIAPLLVARLAGYGLRAQVVTQVPPDACGLIALDGLRPVASVDEALEVDRRVFRAAREIAARMNAAGGVFVTVQDTGGDFGVSGYRDGTDPMRAWLGGLAGLARTAAREWPRASVKAIDCATDRPFAGRGRRRDRGRTGDRRRQEWMWACPPTDRESPWNWPPRRQARIRRPSGRNR